MALEAHDARLIYKLMFLTKRHSSGKTKLLASRRATAADFSIYAGMIYHRLVLMPGTLVPGNTSGGKKLLALYRVVKS